MDRPALSTRMKEARIQAGSRVNSELKIALVVIAAHTRKTEIVHRSCPAGRQRNDMVDLHDHDEFLLSLAILALPPGAFVDLLPDAVGYTRHPL